MGSAALHALASCTPPSFMPTSEHPVPYSGTAEDFAYAAQKFIFVLFLLSSFKLTLL